MLFKNKEVAMLDTVRGPVIHIIDGDTFDITVTYTGKNNKYDYNDQERIRIANIDEPELNTPSGQRSKDELEQKLKGREVRCYIHSRDEYKRLVSDVKVL